MFLSVFLNVYRLDYSLTSHVDEYFRVFFCYGQAWGMEQLVCKCCAATWWMKTKCLPHAYAAAYCSFPIYNTFVGYLCSLTVHGIVSALSVAHCSLCFRHFPTSHICCNITSACCLFAVIRFIYIRLSFISQGAEHLVSTLAHTCGHPKSTLQTVFCLWSLK